VSVRLCNKCAANREQVMTFNVLMFAAQIFIFL